MSPTAPEVSETEPSQFRVKGEIPVPILISWLTAVAVPVLGLFAWRSLDRADPFTPWVLIAAAISLGCNGVIYGFIRNETIQRRIFMTLVTLLFTYVAVHAVEDGTAIIWLFAYPPIVFYISEARVGVAVCLLGFWGIVLLFSPLAPLVVGALFGSMADQILGAPYSNSFKLTMIIVLGFEMVTCYILDQSRRRSKLGLLAMASEFEYAAKHDALTGLANRREALVQLESEHQRFLRNERPFSVLIADIDLFKSVNDTYGHHIGDEFIILVAQTLTKQCRTVDTKARWGGEEYLVLLPETSLDQAAKIAERIRKAIADTPVSVKGKQVSCTASIGVASITKSESVDQLLQRSDEALYRSKILGRNQVCRCPEETEAATAG